MLADPSGCYELVSCQYGTLRAINSSLSQLRFCLYYLMLWNRSLDARVQVQHPLHHIRLLYILCCGKMYDEVLLSTSWVLLGTQNQNVVGSTDHKYTNTCIQATKEHTRDRQEANKKLPIAVNAEGTVISETTGPTQGNNGCSQRIIYRIEIKRPYSCYGHTIYSTCTFFSTSCMSLLTLYSSHKEGTVSNRVFDLVTSWSLLNSWRPIISQLSSHCRVTV